MSSILKALEKVDESQNPRRPAGAGGLPRGRERRPAWLIPAWALGGAAVATLVTYAIMGGFSRHAAPVAQPVGDKIANSAPVAAASSKPVPVAPAAPVAGQQEPAKKAESVANAAAKPVAKPAVTSMAKPFAKAAKPVSNAAKPVSKGAAKPVVKASRLPAAAVAQPAAARPAVSAAPAVATPAPAVVHDEAAAQKPRPEIRVSGIAWQNSSESSFVMVNGRPMRQGGVVDGYKIEQIYEDSVKFSGSNGTIVVPLGAGDE